MLLSGQSATNGTLRLGFCADNVDGAFRQSNFCLCLFRGAASKRRKVLVRLTVAKILPFFELFISKRIVKLVRVVLKSMVVEFRA